jgi:hypothetical protein
MDKVLYNLELGKISYVWGKGDIEAADIYTFL